MALDVVVTGAGGFLALHCVKRLLDDGHRVRGTVRSLTRESRIRQALAGHQNLERLTLVAADLEHDDGWPAAVDGCTHVLHVASPVPRALPRNADEVIRPARDGTLRVLRAASQAGVHRVVLTSSTAAILWGHRRDGSKTFDESDWSVLNDDVAPYEQSKTLAERAAWQFVESLPAEHRFELVTINPGLMLGPLLGDDSSISGEVVRKLLARELPGTPDLGFAPVDVRDVADAHVTAMTLPDAANQRFIVALEHASWARIADILARHFRPRGYRIPTRALPSWVLKTVALFDSTARVAVGELGKRQDVSSAKARRTLGFAPRDLETMVVAMAESLIAKGLVSKSSRQ